MHAIIIKLMENVTNNKSVLRYKDNNCKTYLCSYLFHYIIMKQIEAFYGFLPGRSTQETIFDLVRHI